MIALLLIAYLVIGLLVAKAFVYFDGPDAESPGIAMFFCLFLWPIMVLLELSASSSASWDGWAERLASSNGPTTAAFGKDTAMIDPADWLELAKALPVGGKSSHVHNCGSGRKLLVEHKPNGYAAWCYRCGEPGFVPKARPPLAERIAALKERRDIDQKAVLTIKPPLPAVFDPREWPLEARVWLYKAGFDNDWIEDIGFYWHERLKRVVMPVLSDLNKLVFWQARGFDPAFAKYLSPELGADQHKPIYKAEPVRPVERDASVLCLTEDILSANKVGQVVTGWSLLGTKLNALSEAEIAKFGASKVLVWLDPDEAGVSGRRKIVPQLRARGIDAKAVRADLDPKLYPLEDIRRKLLVHSAT